MKRFFLSLLVGLIGFTVQAQQTQWENSVQQSFDEAVELYNKRLYNSAKTKFEYVLTFDISKHTRWAEESNYYRAMCALYLLNEDAEVLLEEFSLQYPASPLEHKASFAAADYFFNKRNYRKAIIWYANLDQDDLNAEEKSEYAFKMGYSQLMTNDRDNARLNFKRAKEGKEKYSNSAKYYYAHMAYEDSNYVTALENFKELQNDDAFGPIVPYYLAQIYYQNGDLDKLIEYGQPLLERATEKRKPEIAKLLGEAYLAKEDYRKATEYLEIYKQNGGKMKAEDHYSMGFAFYKTNRYADAIQSFNKITGQKNNLGQNAYYHLGDCYLKTDKKQEALGAFKAAYEIGDNEVIKEDALFNYAKLNYELASPYGSAIDAFKKFIDTYPNAVKRKEANKYLANLYLTTKDYENALVAISNTGLDSQEMKEAFQKVSYFRGVQLYNAVKLEEARRFFTQSLKYPSNPTYSALAHFWMAESFYKQQNYNEALKQIELFEATTGSYNLSEFSNARYNKGYCYFMKENYTSATTAFRLFIDNKQAEKQKVKDAELRLGDAYFMQRKYGTAVTYYSKYLAYNPADADYAMFQKALCQGLNGDKANKLATLDKLVSTYPTSKFAVDGLYEQGETYLTMDKNSQALSIFKTFIKDYPQSRHTRRVWLNIGIIYRNMDQTEKALETFKKVVADYPATPEANEAIAFSRLVYADLNRLEEYVNWVETIDFADIKRSSLDSTMFNAGFDFYTNNDCESAMKSFDSYLRKFPDGYFSIQANFFLGECAYKAKNDVVAEEALTRVVNQTRSEYTERSISMLASINYTAQDYAKALFYYEQLLSFSEEIVQLRKARIGAMRCAVKLNLPEKVQQFAEVIINDERIEPEVKSEALVARARSYWALEDLPNAYSSYQEVKTKTKGESQAEASYFIAKIQNINAEYEASNTTIFWMIDNLPSYQKWRFMSLLILADNYYKTEDSFQANYTLDFIIEENYSPEIVAEAKAKKEEIRRAKEQQELEQKQREEELNNELIELEELPEEGGEDEKLNQKNNNN